MKASTLLLNTKIPQTTGLLLCKDGKMCADGILCYHMGYSEQQIMRDVMYPLRLPKKKDKLGDTDFHHYHGQVDEFLSALMSEFGMDKETYEEIQRLNDSGKSFQVIGNWLKEKGL